MSQPAPQPLPSAMYQPNPQQNVSSYVPNFNPTHNSMYGAIPPSAIVRAGGRYHMPYPLQWMFPTYATGYNPMAYGRWPSSSAGAPTPQQQANMHYQVWNYSHVPNVYPGLQPNATGGHGQPIPLVAGGFAQTTNQIEEIPDQLYIPESISLRNNESGPKPNEQNIINDSGTEVTDTQPQLRDNQRARKKNQLSIYTPTEFACNTCGKRFMSGSKSYSRALIRHMATHDIDRTVYVCSGQGGCLSPLARMDAWARHKNNPKTNCKDSVAETMLASEYAQRYPDHKHLLERLRKRKDRLKHQG